MSDMVNNPKHYTAHPSGIECIQITEHMNFNIGNAVKYTWRAGLKTDDPITDLKKARWYLKREIQRIKAERKKAIKAEEKREQMQPLADFLRSTPPDIFSKEFAKEVKFRRPVSINSFPLPTVEPTPEEDEAWDEKRADMIGINGNDGLHYDQAETKLGAHKIDKRGLCVVCGEKWKVGDQITTVCKKEFEDAQVISHKGQSYTRATDSGVYLGGHYGAYFEPSDLSGGPYVFMCDQCGDVIEYGQEVIRVCPGKPCDHTSGLHSYSSTKEAQCIDCKEVMPGKDDAKLTTHKRKSGVGPDT